MGNKLEGKVAVIPELKSLNWLLILLVNKSSKNSKGCGCNIHETK